MNLYGSSQCIRYPRILILASLCKNIISLSSAFHQCIQFWFIVSVWDSVAQWFAPLAPTSEHQRSGVQNLGVHTVSFHLSHIHLSLFGPFPFSYLKLYQNDPRNSKKFIDKCARTGKTWRKGVQLRKNWSVPKPDKIPYHSVDNVVKLQPLGGRFKSPLSGIWQETGNEGTQEIFWSTSSVESSSDW